MVNYGNLSLAQLHVTEPLTFPWLKPTACNIEYSTFITEPLHFLQQGWGKNLPFCALQVNPLQNILLFKMKLSNMDTKCSSSFSLVLILYMYIQVCYRLVPVFELTQYLYLFSIFMESKQSHLYHL